MNVLIRAMVRIISLGDINLIFLLFGSVIRSKKTFTELLIRTIEHFVFCLNMLLQLLVILSPFVCHFHMNLKRSPFACMVKLTGKLTSEHMDDSF